MHRTTILDNGITVITSPMPSAKTAAVHVGVNVGSHFEDDTQRGLAHFLEHMVFNGTKRFPTHRELHNFAEEKGIYFCAYTSYSKTIYHCKGHHKDTNTMLEFTNEIFQHPTFPESSLKKERGIIIQEIKMYNDNHAVTAREIAGTYLYEGEPSSYSVIGTIESVSAFKIDDFVRFHDKYYVAENTVISVAGNIDEEEVIETIKKLYADMPRGEKVQYKEQTAKPIEKPHNSLVRKESEQVNFTILFRSLPSTHADTVVGQVVEEILSDGWNSRLWGRLRDQMGACYTLAGGIYTYPAMGEFYIAAGIQDTTVEKVIKAIAEEIEKLCTEIVPEDELQIAKTKITSAKALKIESANGMADTNIYDFTSTGKIQEYEDFVKEIEKVSAEDVQRVAKDIFRGDNVVVSYVGNIDVPKSHSQPLLDL